MSESWLLAYDFSDTAKKALHYAAEQLSERPKAKMILLNVHAPLHTTVSTPLLSSQIGDQRKLDDAIISSAEEAFVKLLAEIEARYPTLHFEYKVAVGLPAECITEHAFKEGVQQIVVGSHNRKGVARLFLGSVAERVLRLSKRPVLIVKGETKD